MSWGWAPSGARVEDVSVVLASLRDEFEHVAAAGECADFEHDNRAGIARVVGVFDARHPRRA